MQAKVMHTPSPLFDQKASHFSATTSLVPHDQMPAWHARTVAPSRVFSSDSWAHQHPQNHWGDVCNCMASPLMRRSQLLLAPPLPVQNTFRTWSTSSPCRKRQNHSFAASVLCPFLTRDGACRQQNALNGFRASFNHKYHRAIFKY